MTSSPTSPDMRTGGGKRWKQRMAHIWQSAWSRMYNLNDPRWGRGEATDDRPAAAHNPPPPQDGREQPPTQAPQQPPQTPPPPQGGARRPEGPPDLDEIWQDFNRKISGLFNAGKGGGTGGGAPQSAGGSGTPDGLGIGLIVAALALVWLLTGFFIVQEGQQSVITRFGKYRATVGAGINWRFPYPIEHHETINVTQIRSKDIGGDIIIKSTGLRDSAMLTSDENIVEIKFAVQYRLNSARDYLFASRDPEEAVRQTAETAVREVIGGMRMDAALAEERDQIAPRVARLMQTILDRYKVGIEVVGVNLQQGGVRPPEQVQAAFDDVLKAGQERSRAQNEAQAYANRVIPLAAGTAARLKSESEAYKAKVVAQAQGDAERFSAILPEYQKAPQATRDRMYNDTMQQIYSNVTKILVDTKQGSMLYLPLDKILQTTSAAAASQPAAATAAAATVPAPTVADAALADARNRNPDYARSRNAP